MTRRERLENKLEKRKEWAEKASQRCSAEFEAAHQITEHIPLGQPILVGHHSEGAHRRALERSARHMDRGCEEFEKARYHEAKAEGLASQLETTIFSDDPDAVERWRQRSPHWRPRKKNSKKLIKFCAERAATKRRSNSWWWTRPWRYRRRARGWCAASCRATHYPTTMQTSAATNCV